jgi:hypothetical protein
MASVKSEAVPITYINNNGKEQKYYILPSKVNENSVRRKRFTVKNYKNLDSYKIKCKESEAYHQYWNEKYIAFTEGYIQKFNENIEDITSEELIEKITKIKGEINENKEFIKRQPPASAIYIERQKIIRKLEEEVSQPEEKLDWVHQFKEVNENYQYAVKIKRSCDEERARLLIKFSENTLRFNAKGGKRKGKKTKKTRKNYRRFILC